MCWFGHTTETRNCVFHLTCSVVVVVDAGRPPAKRVVDLVTLISKRTGLPIVDSDAAMYVVISRQCCNRVMFWYMGFVHRKPFIRSPLPR